MAKQPNVYEQLFTVFIDEAREKKDVQAVAKSYVADFVGLLISDLGPSGAARFRGFSLSESKQDAADGSKQVLLIIRGWDLGNNKVITFANGPSFELACFAWLHTLVSGDLKWKPDEDRKAAGGVTGLLDAVGSTAAKG